MAHKKYPKRRVPDAVVNQLTELQDLLRMRPGRFGGCDDVQTKALVDGTQRWREAWVLPQIQQLIDWANGERQVTALFVRG